MRLKIKKKKVNWRCTGKEPIPPRNVKKENFSLISEEKKKKEAELAL